MQEIEMPNNLPENRIHSRFFSKEERQLHIEKWQASKLTMSAYCRRNDLPLSSFSGWRRVGNRPKTGDAKTSFKPIQMLSSVETTKKSDNVIEIILDQQIKMRLLNVKDVMWVASLFKELMR